MRHIVSLVVLSSVLAGAASAQFSSSTRPIENALLFHPVKAKEYWSSPPPGANVQDVWLKTASGTTIHAWWFPGETTREAILFCHGNAGNLVHRTFEVQTLIRATGKSVLIFDYPGYGASYGSPSEQGCYDAANAAYDWLTETQGIRPRKLVLFGESLGGGVATDLASRRSHQALVLVKTFTSIPDMARKSMLTSASASIVSQRFDNLSKIRRCGPNVFIAHGDRDRLVPFTQARTLFDAAIEPKRFFTLRGCDHNDPLTSEFRAALAEFLEGLRE